MALNEMFEQEAIDSEKTLQAKDEVIGAISDKVNALDKLKQGIKETEDFLKGLTKQAYQLEAVEIPELMAEHGFSKLETLDGFGVKLERGVAAKIAKAKEAEAFDWLRVHGHDDIIKNQIATTFGRGEDEKAEALQETLRDNGYEFDHKQSVHYQTLNALVREQVQEQGNPEFLSEEAKNLLGVYQYNKVKVTKS